MLKEGAKSQRGDGKGGQPTSLPESKIKRGRGAKAPSKGWDSLNPKLGRGEVQYRSIGRPEKKCLGKSSERARWGKSPKQPFGRFGT